MTAEIKPRINLEGRTRLETVIPLSTPYLVFLDPSDACNAKCPWCPTGSGEALKYKKPMVMDFDLYKKIINDMCDMPEPIKTLRLYSDGEPLLNANLHKMVKYAYESKRFFSIDTTTNALLLTPKRGQQLIDAGLDKIFVSVPGDYDEEYVDRIRNFYSYSSGRCLVYAKIIGDHLSEEAKEQFYCDFGSISDRVFVENLSPCWPNFDVGKVGDKGIYNQPLKPAPKVCPYIFYSTKINSDGTVSLCFLDWARKLILGDLKKERFKDIWNGDLLLNYRTFNLVGKRKHLAVCNNCQQLVYGAPDNIDVYAEELLRRIAREHLGFDWPT